MKRAMSTLTLAAVGSAAALAAALPSPSGAQPSARAAHGAAPAAVDPVIAWNRFLLGVQATPGDQPATIHPTYQLAMLHAAIHDAVVTIDHRGRRYLTHVHGVRGASVASVAAAADAAAHATLAKLYPSLRASIDQQFAALLARVPAGPRKTLGVRVGRRVAAQLLARRADDGSSASPPAFQPGMGAGDYQLTPPAFAPPVFTHWPHVKPFVITRANRFRPPPPAPLTSPKYAAAINEVKTLGAAQGSTRTPDQTQIGQFWNAPIWATWNQIAQTAALAHHNTLSQNASTFAALDLTLADSVIAFYDAKYAYHLWRPVTAIHNADTDGNPDTAPDPTWTPLSTTAPDPSYPGAHGTISAAAADILSSIYGNDLAFTATSPALPGVARPFVSFSEAAHEATVSRIYNGNHTRLDQVAGENLGHDIASFMLQRNAPRGPAAR